MPDDHPPESEHDRAVDDQEMPLVEHLIELRSRLLRAILSVFVAFVPMYFFANEIYEWIARPLVASLAADVEMIAIDPASPFLTPFKTALFAALFLAIPFVLHQAWAYVAPGLYSKEKRFAAPLLISSVLLFYCGVLFAYYAVFPLIFQFFASVTPANVVWMTDINRYLNFVMKLFFAFGLVFEIPIATFLLVRAGFTTPDQLAAKRPYIIIGCFVLGMLLTPPDIISQVLLAIPTWALFEVGVLLSRIAQRQQAADDDTAEQDDAFGSHADDELGPSGQIADDRNET